MSRARVRHRMAAAVGMVGRHRRVSLVGAAAFALAALLVLDAAFPLPLGALHRAPARVVTDAHGVPLRIFLPADGRYRMPVRLADVSPLMVRTLVGSEDRWFWWHPGVNPFAVGRAMVTNLRAGRVVSGASTIPMQIARLVEPKRRTLGGKVAEALRALQLEWYDDKEELLELYLNLTPYGANLEGVGSAAWFYFGKRADQLSLGEAALLTTLPRSPVAYDPVRHPAAATRARDRVLRQLLARGVVTEREVQDALLHSVPSRRQPAPFEAPHFARLAVERLPATDATIRTSLDLDTQRATERRVRTRIDSLRAEGLGNAAVVVIDNATRSVRAMVGSAGFFETAQQGQVNGALAARSPGSTLKPLLYAQALDAGLIAPASFMLDVPTDFAGYVAENYDGEYRGRVTATDALRWSLNAPAVRLLARAGLREFHQLLNAGGLATLDKPPLHYGLPLVLGAGEARLVDLVNLYATLADGGMHRQWTLSEQTPAKPTRLVSAAAAALVTRVLGEVERPDMPAAWELTRDVPAVAWKTGTSYGHRDAWAIGFSRTLSIGVWVGNLDGSAQKGISGARHAGPLLFDVFRALESASELPLPGLEDVADVRVCAESHQLPGPFCPRKTRIEVIPGVTQLRTCEDHRRVFVDTVSGERLSGDCLADRPHRAVVLEVLPAELMAWHRAQGRATGTMPPLSAACTGVPGAEPPRIVTPVAATPYVLRAEAPPEHQRIALTAQAAAGARRLYWYQDGALVGSAEPGSTVFVNPEIGEHELVVVDDSGRADELRYRVE